MQEKVFVLADDDLDDRELFCEALESADTSMVCHAVSDGRQALALLERLAAPPALIFLDINMPIMGGWQCLEKIKQTPSLEHVPVIMMSTSSHEREMDIARRMGAFCYFTKPHHFNDLISVLVTIVTNSGTELAPALRKLKAAGSPYISLLAED